MNPADVQAILAEHDSPSPSLEGLQRLADWGTAMQKMIGCVRFQDKAVLTPDECWVILHYIQLMGG